LKIISYRDVVRFRRTKVRNFFAVSGYRFEVFPSRSNPTVRRSSFVVRRERKVKVSTNFRKFDTAVRSAVVFRGIRQIFAREPNELRVNRTFLFSCGESVRLARKIRPVFICSVRHCRVIVIYFDDIFVAHEEEYSPGCSTFDRAAVVSVVYTTSAPFTGHRHCRF